MPFQPWKPVCRLTLRFFPLCVYVCVCVMLLIETSGWETKRSQREREKESHHHRCWRDIELYLLGGTQHGALFGSVLSRRNRPADGWPSRPLALSLWSSLVHVFARRPHIHTPLCSTAREKERNEWASKKIVQEWSEKDGGKKNKKKKSRRK